jgi:hypothetical protein
MIGPDKKTHSGTSHLEKVDKDTFTWRGTDQVVDDESAARLAHAYLQAEERVNRFRFAVSNKRSTARLMSGR